MKNFLRFALIIGTLPNTLTNGTVADATQVMADLNKIVNDVNANAAPLANTALLNATNNFTAVQTGIAATSGVNFPIASQVQNQVFNTLTSTLGTNTITSRVAALTLTGYATGQVFTFYPTQRNTGATTLNIDGQGALPILSLGSALVGGELNPTVPVQVLGDGAKFDIISTTKIGTTFSNSLTANVVLNNTGQYFDGPSVAQGTVGRWLAMGTITVNDTSGAAWIADVKLWDGTTVIASCHMQGVGASGNMTASLSGTIPTPAGNIRISVNDITSTSGNILFNASGNSKDSTITVLRVA